MARRINNLHLLYRCINSGASIDRFLRKSLLEFIAKSHVEMARIFNGGGVYPISDLDPDGIRHIYYCHSNKRKTLSEPLLSARKLSNEILLSPIAEYSDVAINLANQILLDTDKKSLNTLTNLGTSLNLILPIVSTKPKEILDILSNISNVTDTNYLKPVKSIVDKSITVIEKNFL